MAFKALFPPGQDRIVVEGLYQWDYGQELEIETVDVDSEIMEVHFACADMAEAIVRPCTFVRGVGTVIIPDACLEQSTPITAWIYEIDGTQGKTRKVITRPIVARTRPSASREIPQAYVDRYAELITEVNEAVDNLEQGNVTVAKAVNAEKATHATSAGNASSANYASTAGAADTANRASELVIEPLYTSVIGACPSYPGVYLAEVEFGGRVQSGIISIPDINSKKTICGHSFGFTEYAGDPQTNFLRLEYTTDGELIAVNDLTGDRIELSAVYRLALYNV